MLINPDFSEIQDAVEAGTYKVRIKKGEVKEWPRGGTYVNWEMETFGEAEAKNNGRRIFHKTATSGKGAFTLQQLYKAATGQALTGSFDTESVVSKEVVVELVDGVNRETNEPTGYTEVKKVKPISAVA